MGSRRKLIKEQVTCPNCKGKGCVWDHELGVFTSGLGYLFQALDDNYKADCPRCGGKGYITRTIEEIYED